MDKVFMNPEDERKYLIELLFQLTIVFRDQNETLSGDERQTSLVQINEINHRILNRIRDLDQGEKWTTRKATGDRILKHLENAPKLAPMFKWASEKAYENVHT